MENKYVNMSHNYNIMTRASRMIESYKLREKIKVNPSKLSFENTIEERTDDVSSTPNTELSSDYSITFSDDSEDVISDISIYYIANTRNINSDKMLNSSTTQEIENITAEQNIINQEFKITDETFLKTMGCALNYFSNELSTANNKPQQYRQNLTKNVTLFRQVIEDFEKDIEKRRGML